MKNKKNKQVNEKFYSFLNATILGRGQRKKFPEVFNIPIYNKEQWKFGKIKFVSKRNKIVLLTILRGYLIFWFAIFCAAHMFYEDFKANFKKPILLEEDISKNLISKNMFDIDTLYYFFKYSFNEFYEANDYIRDIAESFMCDLNYFDQFIDKYNLSFFYSLNFFFLLLNI